MAGVVEPCERQSGTLAQLAPHHPEPLAPERPAVDTVEEQPVPAGAVLLDVAGERLDDDVGQGDRAIDRADFGGPNVGSPRSGVTSCRSTFSWRRRKSTLSSVRPVASD
jgi:hypothetical protein